MISLGKLSFLNKSPRDTMDNIPMLVASAKIPVYHRKQYTDRAWGVPSSILKNRIKTRYIIVNSNIGFKIDHKCPINEPW